MRDKEGSLGKAGQVSDMRPRERCRGICFIYWPRLKGSERIERRESHQSFNPFRSIIGDKGWP